MIRFLRYNQIRHGLTSTSMLVVAAAAVIVIGTTWMVGGGGGEIEDIGESDLYEIIRGDFDITIPASGELSALERVDIRCQLDDQAAITEIIEEGATVAEGDLLFKLDDQGVLERIQNIEEDLVSAQNTLRNREAQLEIAHETRDSELQKAQVKVDQAELALLAWREGEVRTTLEQNELEVTTAEKDYNRLQEKYEKSVELFGKRFISKDDLEKDEIDMIRAAANLNKTRLVKEMYEKYTYKKEKLQKESDRDQALAEKIRTGKRNDASVRSRQDDVEAAKKTLESKQERLDKWQEQLERCVVHAPSAGMVIYGSTINRDRRGEETPLQVGKKLYRNELVIVLPNVDQMAANVKVNEALSGLITAGQSVLLRTDAIPDAVIDGTVLGVSVLAEDGGWRDPNRRDYRVDIKIDDGHDLPLKPSMRVKANIHVATVVDVVYVPVQSIHRRGRYTFVYKAVGGGYAEHPVTIDRNSELYAEITNGLEIGDQILLVDPPAGTVVERIDDGSEA